jgi:hypothetical protein
MIVFWQPYPFFKVPIRSLLVLVRKKILELRKLAQDKLGKEFNIREFHDEVLKDGSIPLQILEEKINRWIEIKLMEL